MFFLLFFLNICMAQDGIWKSMCVQTSDCIGHLICIDGLCAPPNPPTAEQCQTLSFVHIDLRGHAISACPPACGFEQEVVYGPRCVQNEQGCALASKCRVEGKCSFNGNTCIETEEGCANSLLCKPGSTSIGILFSLWSRLDSTMSNDFLFWWVSGAFWGLTLVVSFSVTLAGHIFCIMSHCRTIGHVMDDLR